MQIRRRKSRTVEQIIKEWDALAPTRLTQIISGQDITFNYILAPGILSLINGQNFESAIDAGCGIGILTVKLSKLIANIIGVDPSGKSIAIAKSSANQSLRFVQSTLEDFSRHSPQPVELIVANMVLMDTSNLDQFLGAVSTLLKPSGAFVFSIVHPCFWPEYYGYVNERWFDYSKEIIVESPFRISNQPDSTLFSTYVHRPLARYLEAFHKANMFLEVMREPMPSKSIARLYPRPWENPRYIIGRCRKLPSKQA